MHFQDLVNYFSPLVPCNESLPLLRNNWTAKHVWILYLVTNFPLWQQIPFSMMLNCLRHSVLFFLHFVESLYLFRFHHTTFKNLNPEWFLIFSLFAICLFSSTFLGEYFQIILNWSMNRLYLSIGLLLWCMMHWCSRGLHLWAHCPPSLGCSQLKTTQQENQSTRVEDSNVKIRLGVLQLDTNYYLEAYQQKDQPTNEQLIYSWGTMIELLFCPPKIFRGVF